MRLALLAFLASAVAANDEHLHPHTDMAPTPLESTPSLVPTPHVAHHHHGMPILDTDLKPEERLFWENYSTETYFNTPSSHRGALYTHIALWTSSYMLLYPLVLVFWNTGSRLYFPALTLHAAAIVISVINYWVFAGSIKDLYPGNAFHPMCAILFVGTIVHWAVALISKAYSSLDIETHAYEAVDDDDDTASLDSPASTLRDSHSDSFELDDLTPGLANGHLTSNGSMINKPGFVTSFVVRFPLFQRVVTAFGRTATVLTAVLNWMSFFYFLVYAGVAVATYAVYGTDRAVFNLLAHFIKGGVFFSLGMLSLSRYCGAFREKGWAWNHTFVSAKKAYQGWFKWQPIGLWSMEFVESSLILFYGSTNIFLEHLANPGGEWSAKDLQHASIAFIFIGCGLCGVLVEKKLSSYRFQKATEHMALVADSKDVARVAKAMPGFSPNPFPILTIYWTGVLMSKHEQASELSTAIHTQWGNLFVVGCAFRLLTYVLQMVTPVNSKSLTRPSSPMTELVVSFALMCGGTIFMESCDPVVHTFEYYGYTPMFTLNVTLGVVTLLMAWIMSVFAFKDWLQSKKVSLTTSSLA
ncbi:uncharacterized protein CXQ87_002057 [Candidozyma duobushaemuli]|uniref:Integral membrane protein n=2 Tax=Candidozyma TaxID=3303203 RepID=A0ABX8I3L0_9ASCO|nr:uncharacterized protein CXQ87_002057 [[Candida] duobushaemulonis]PVH13938.1 hypothetical protein CXQ87_002057 [[Candida] duobushaemulonis]QWU87844.1 hypothetical protein CA3LBN_002109 [[Candida] haemuloni]